MHKGDDDNDGDGDHVRYSKLGGGSQLHALHCYNVLNSREPLITASAAVAMNHSFGDGKLDFTSSTHYWLDCRVADKPGSMEAGLQVVSFSGNLPTRMQTSEI